MLTDEQLIQRIGAELQAGLAVLDPPEDLLEQLRERSTRDRGRWRQRTREPATRGRAVLGFGRAITVLSVAVVIGIAAGALVLLGGHRSAPTPNTSAGFATRQQLLQTLGVLRTQPNAAARRAIACAKAMPGQRTNAFTACLGSALPTFFLLPPSPSRHSTLRQRQHARLIEAREGYPRLDPSLLRAVLIPHFDASVTIAPTTWQPSPGSHRRSEGLVAEINRPGQQYGTGPEPTSLATVTSHGLWISNAQATPTQAVVFGAVIVPDGVAKVKLEPIRVVSPPAPLNPGQFGSVTAQVHDNVAPFRFPVPTATNPQKQSALYGVTVIAHATWFDQGGRVIDRTTTQLYLSINLRGQGVSSGTIP